MQTKTQIFEIPDIDWTKVNVLLDSLLKIDSALDFCKAVVHSGFSGGYVQGCQLYNLGEDAQLTIVAGYGQSFDHLQDRFSVWDENPISEAVRSKSFTFISATEISRPMIVVPLLRDTSPIGAVTLVMSESITSNPIDEDLIPVLEKISGYWLTSNNTRPVLKSSLSVEANGENLTNRQLRILTLMADGLVNSEIANELVVSESTIRQETVRIYRELGVANRSEASRKGKLLGLIKASSK